jgi:hypothetical protein
LRKSGARNRGELIARSFVAGILDAARWPPSVCQEDGLDKRVLETRVAIPGEPLPPMTSFSAG